MTNKIRSLLCASAIFAIGICNANAASFHGIADPATSLQGAGLGGLTITSGFVDSKSQYKDDFGSLGDLQVESALESASWFNTPITLLSSPTSGNCSTGLVSCLGGSGVYNGLLNSLADNANLFVVHVGGKYNDGGGCANQDRSCTHTGGIVLAFLYSSLINNFNISGFENGVSWIRAYRTRDVGDLGPGPVPLPGGIALLLSALGGLGVVSHRRNLRKK